ncbi:MAG: hypothetical protein VX007_07790, partial [Pseudomonadota bacterium]|nr:hypothetical protein [Pseudomonadota bacterium]
GGINYADLLAYWLFMLYAQNINDCLASEIGDGGLEQAAFERYLNKVSVFLPSIRAGVANV